LNKISIILLAISIAIISGCNSVNFPVYFENTTREPIEIEILRPADTIIDLSIKKILIFIKPGLVSNLSVIEGKTNLSGSFQLSDLPGTEFRSMAELLSASPRFELLEATGTIRPPAGKNYDWEELDSICTRAGVDACLFLDEQNILMGVSKPGIRNYDEGLSSNNNYSTGYIMFNSTYEFCCPKLKMSLTKTVKTGVSFQAALDDFDSEFNSPEGVETLIHDYAAENGEKFSGWIAPVWQRDTRNYFLKGNAELESVKPLVAEEKWEMVFEIWRRNMKSESPSVAKHAFYNSIISYEMRGKLDSAVSLTNEAYNRFKSEEFVDYGLILQERLRESGVVNQQLGISNRE